MGVRRVIVTALAGVSVLAAGAEGTALADPVPRPPAPHARTGPAARDRVPAGYPRRARHHRPRTVVRCQNDGTDQVDEIDGDDDGPRHYVSPGISAPAGSCPGAREALALAGLLDGSRPTTRLVRRTPVRRLPVTRAVR